MAWSFAARHRKDDDTQISASLRVIRAADGDAIVLADFDFDANPAALNTFADRLGLYREAARSLQITVCRQGKILIAMAVLASLKTRRVMAVWPVMGDLRSFRNGRSTGPMRKIRQAFFGVISTAAFHPMILRKINTFPPPPTGLFRLKPFQSECLTFWLGMRVARFRRPRSHERRAQSR